MGSRERSATVPGSSGGGGGTRIGGPAALGFDRANRRAAGARCSVPRAEAHRPAHRPGSAGRCGYRRRALVRQSIGAAQSTHQALIAHNIVRMPQVHRRWPMGDGVHRGRQGNTPDDTAIGTALPLACRTVNAD
ncbi:hypothetical protein RSSE_p1727 (plasmid) [Ralstonia solanacearum]|nr:hypothetical protein RSSE_p1727 [Ralstonia solanacearum]